MRLSLACFLVVVTTVSPDAGAQITWQRVWGPSPVNVEALAFSQSGSAFAATSGLFGLGLGILRSTDEGLSWTTVNNGLADTNAAALLCSPSGDLLAGMWVYGSSGNSCVYRTTDEGDSWSRSDSGLSGSYICFAFAVDSTGDLYAGLQGGGDVSRSTDNGRSWFPTTSFTPNGCYAIAVHPGGTVFAATLLLGIFSTTDKGTTWNQDTTGLTNKFVYDLLATPGGDLYAGTGGFFATGVFRSTNLGANWHQTALDNAMIGALTQSGDGTLFAGTSSSGVYSSTDNGNTWAQNNSGLSTLHVTSLAVSPAGFIYAGTDSGGIFRSSQPLVSVPRDAGAVPLAFALHQNYPNPFNPVSTVGFSIAESRFVTLKVYDILGREVAVPVNEKKEPGYYEVTFHAEGLSSGVYFYKLEAGNFSQTRKLIVIR